MDDFLLQLLVNGVIVFLFGGVGPTLGASLVAWAGVRRRR